MTTLLGEAWDWLVLHGLISLHDLSDHSAAGWARITRRGYELADDPATLARIRAEIRLGVDLHPRIEAVVRSQFSAGDYETAVFVAMREVEIRVRELSQQGNSVIGVNLMTTAFNPKGGPLCDPTLDSGEQVAMMALFQGAIGVFKNPSSHRPVTYDDPTEASEVVLLADLLMRLLDRVEQRI